MVAVLHDSPEPIEQVLFLLLGGIIDRILRAEVAGVLECSMAVVLENDGVHE